jgi:phage protein D
VRVNGSPLPDAAAHDLLAVDVYEDLDAPGMCTLLLNNWDAIKQKITWSDDKLFTEGGAVEVEMGYVDNLTKIFDGEITGLELAFETTAPPRLIVRCHDRRHRLLRGHKTRAFVKKKDSQIASQIAGEDGLSGQVEDSKVVLEYVLQHNQTDWEFLSERAARIGYEVVVDAKKLLFRPYQHQQSAVLTLKREEALIEFFPRLVTLHQVDKVEVVGWNTKEKKAVVGAASAPNGSMGRSSGAQASKKAFGAASGRGGDQPVLSAEEAKALAQGQLDERALAFITGDGLCQGDTKLRAGKVIEIEGFGKRFSGQYYVASTRHSIRPESGYRTGFTVKRNAS